LDSQSWLALTGGLGLFLFGLATMRDGLEKVAAERLKPVIQVLAGTLTRGVAAGTVVTALVQSSTAVTVMVVGLVDAGAMTLEQAVGVIMGANLGTTITAQLIAFRVGGFSYLAILVGALIRLFGRSESQKRLGEAVAGAGLIFAGLTAVSAALIPLHQHPGFGRFLTAYGTVPVVAFFFGALLTALVQSSAVVVGLCEVLAAQGFIDIFVAFPAVLGSNVGTCVTALLSSLGTSLTARRAAVSHLLLNVLGAVGFLVISRWIAPLSTLGAIEPARQVANAHTFFNFVSGVILLPFAPQIVALAKRVVPANGVGRGRRPRGPRSR
jgi:phosphate:Na+ symporter